MNERAGFIGTGIDGTAEIFGFRPFAIGLPMGYPDVFSTETTETVTRKIQIFFIGR